MKKILLSIAALTAINGFAMAGGDIVPVAQEIDDTGWYAGVGIAYDNVYSDTQRWFNDATDTQDELGSPVGIIGYDFNEYIGVEGRIGKSFFKEDYADLTRYSLFLKPHYRFRDRNDLSDDSGYFSVYGLLGFGYVKVKGENGNIPAHPDVIGKTILSDTSFQWGLGLSYTFVDRPKDDRYALKDTWTVFLDYVMYDHNAHIDSTLYSYDPKVHHKLSVDGLTLGVLYRF